MSLQCGGYSKCPSEYSSIKYTLRLLLVRIRWLAMPLYLSSMVFTNKEKHSLTRKLVGYRNWRQRWCKTEGKKKRKMREK